MSPSSFYHSIRLFGKHYHAEAVLKKCFLGVGVYYFPKGLDSM